MTELEIRMLDVENISKLVIENQIEFSNHPMHNQYMTLVWNLDALKQAIFELEILLNIKK
jgi:hypothetical protein